jgi:hypothetical protein
MINIYEIQNKTFVLTYLPPICKLGIVHFKIFNAFYFMWPRLNNFYTQKFYFNYFNNISTYIWRFYTWLGHTHWPRHYNSDDLYLVLCTFCIVWPLVRHMGSHITSMICTVLYLILMFLWWWPVDGLFRLKHAVIPE